MTNPYTVDECKRIMAECDTTWAAASLEALREFVTSPSYAATLSAASKLNATRAEIPGLWYVPGYPELTTNQLVQIAAASSI